MRRLLLPAALLALLPFATAAEEAKPVEPFNGKDLTGWKFKDEKKSKWRVMQVVVNEKEPNVFSKPAALGDRNELVNVLDPGEHGCDIYTEQKFGDILLELEFMVPKNSNSGIYLM